MNELDIAILLVTALSCIFGFWRGFVKEILALVTWIAALLIAWAGSDHLSGLMANIIENDSVRDISAFALIFIMVVLLGSVLSRVLAKLLIVTGLRFFDSFLGGMSIGYFLYSRLTPKFSHSLFKIYGVTELLIGVWTIFSPVIFRAISKL